MDPDKRMNKNPNNLRHWQDIQGFYENTSQNINVDVPGWKVFVNLLKGVTVYEQDDSTFKDMYLFSVYQCYIIRFIIRKWCVLAPVSEFTIPSVSMASIRTFPDA